MSGLIKLTIVSILIAGLVACTALNDPEVQKDCIHVICEIITH